MLLAAQTQTITTPSVAYHALMPIFLVLGAAILGVLIEAFVPRRERFAAQLVVTLAGIVGAFIAVIALRGTKTTTPSPAGNDSFFSGTLAIDGTGLFIQGTVLVTALIYLAVSLVVDLSYGFLDPRIRYD